MSMAWVVGGSAVLGIGSSLIGANQQKKAIEGANAATIAASKEADRQNWLRYLMARGINPSPNTQAGEVPGIAPGGAMNTKLPIWAKATMTQRAPQFIRRVAPAAAAAAPVPAPALPVASETPNPTLIRNIP